MRTLYELFPTIYDIFMPPEFTDILVSLDVNSFSFSLVYIFTYSVYQRTLPSEPFGYF